MSKIQFPVYFGFGYLVGTEMLFAVLILVFSWYIKSYKKSEKTNSSRTDFPRMRWSFFSALDGFVAIMKIRKDGIKLFEEMTSQCGSIFRCPILSRECIAISDPNIIQKVLSSSNMAHLNKPRYYYDLLFTDAAKNGLVASDVSIWAPHRKAVASSFLYKAFPTYFKFMNDEAQEIVKAASSLTRNGSVENLQMKELIDHGAVKIITKIILGCDNCQILDEDLSQFHAHFKLAKDISLERFQRPEMLFPPLWMIHPKKRILDLAEEMGRMFSDKIIDAYRKIGIAKANENIDYFDTSLDANTEAENFWKDTTNSNDLENELGIKSFSCLVEQMIKAGLSNKEITDEVLTFMVAGHESIITAMDFLIFQLASNPIHQQKCREEIDYLFNSKDDLELDDLPQLKYLERCILESLRITPTIPIFLRYLDEPLHLEGNNYLDANQTLMILPWVVHRNPEIYPNPTKFDPDRFLPENVKQRHYCSFIPFSLGARNCIGWKTALMEMKILMAWLIKNFEMTTTDDENDVKLLFDVTLKLERPYNITFTQIRNENEM